MRLRRGITLASWSNMAQPLNGCDYDVVWSATQRTYRVQHVNCRETSGHAVAVAWVRGFSNATMMARRTHASLHLPATWPAGEPAVSGLRYS